MESLRNKVGLKVRGLAEDALFGRVAVQTALSRGGVFRHARGPGEYLEFITSQEAYLRVSYKYINLIRAKHGLTKLERPDAKKPGNADAAASGETNVEQLSQPVALPKLSRREQIGDSTALVWEADLAQDKYALHHIRTSAGGKELKVMYIFLPSGDVQKLRPRADTPEPLIAKPSTGELTNLYDGLEKLEYYRQFINNKLQPSYEDLQQLTEAVLFVEPDTTAGAA